MEVLDVEAVTQLSFRQVSQLFQFELSDLVACCLARPGYIAVNLEKGDASTVWLSVELLPNF